MQIFANTYDDTSKLLFVSPYDLENIRQALIADEIQHTKKLHAFMHAYE